MSKNSWIIRGTLNFLSWTAIPNLHRVWLLVKPKSLTGSWRKPMRKIVFSRAELLIRWKYIWKWINIFLEQNFLPSRRSQSTRTPGEGLGEARSSVACLHSRAHKIVDFYFVHRFIIVSAVCGYAFHLNYTYKLRSILINLRSSTVHALLASGESSSTSMYF